MAAICGATMGFDPGLSASADKLIE